MTEIVFGPPGTGKTTALLEYVDQELKSGTPPDRIAYISFTRRAAEEAITRACAKFKLSRKEFPYFRTLHSLCYHGLDLSNNEVMTEAKIQEFADYARIKITGHWSEDGTFSGQAEGDRALRFDNMARVRCVSLRAEYNRDRYSGVDFHTVDRVSRYLRAFKDANYLMDFTDFLEGFLRSDSSMPEDLEVLVVDEGQDLSPLQWRVVDRLAQGCRRVIVAGDDDQAIYQWAGADVQCLLNLEGSVRILQQSWRVPKGIQHIALSLANKIKNRQPKEWRAREANGSVSRARSLEEIDFSGQDIMILVRNEYLMGRVRSILKREGIVYECHGHSSIKEKYLEAAEHWETLRKGDAITIEEARKVYSLMSVGARIKRGCKTLPGREADETVTLSGLQSDNGLFVGREMPWYDALDRLPVEDVSYMRRARTRGVKLRERPPVRLSTIHTAKGAEAEHVVLLKEVAKRSHQEAEMSPDDELRVWYVAVTRAREKLTLVDSSTQLRCQWL